MSKNQARRVVVVVAASVVLLPAFGMGSALAASPSQLECEAAGGTFDRQNGQVSCTFATSDPVGNSESSDGKSQTRDTTDTDTGQGNSGNKPASEECTTGPGNQTTCP